ncbi:hypothetical protein [Brevundimonas nasdae]|nr:hypothetical protein [Brevundimonas nasdae]
MGQGFTSTALAALMMGVATPVIAQSSDVARRFEIAAGPLDRSLPEFARQSGLQILYPSALVCAAGVGGEIPAEQFARYTNRTADALGAPFGHARSQIVDPRVGDVMGGRAVRRHEVGIGGGDGEGPRVRAGLQEEVSLGVSDIAVQTEPGREVLPRRQKDALTLLIRQEPLTFELIRPVDPPG